MKRVAVLLAVSALSAAGVGAQGTPPPRFTSERPVETGGAGPRRLQPDVALLAGARPFTSMRASRGSDELAEPVAYGGLSDLRLFDSTGRDVPYLFIHPPQPERVWGIADVLEVPATKKVSGFEADLRDVIDVDAIRVNGIPAPFLKRLAVEGSGDRQHWTVLQAEATLFDLPEERLQQLEIFFTPGPYRYLRVTWNDANSGKVPMPLSVQARRVATGAAPPPLTAVLSVEQRPSEPGASRYRVRLPAAHLPIVALELQVTNERVMRPARVTESRIAGSRAVPVELGRATLRRVVRDGIAAEALRIPIAMTSDAQVDVAVDDGSNPPLQLTAIRAVFATLPYVYFEAGDSPIIARYGDPKLDAPRYDLEAARDSIRIDTVADARWGEPHALTPAPAPAQVVVTTGATIDPSAFKTFRAIASGGAGLVTTPLDAAVLAHSRGPSSSFADVRIVDGNNRQVPYILEQRDEPLAIELPLRPATLQARAGAPLTAHTSVYAIALPYVGLPSPRLVLTTRSAVFSRQLTLGAERAPDRVHRDRWFQVLASADWAHSDDREPAPPLSISFQPAGETELRLLVDEGDNAPLPLEKARLLLPAYALRFYRENGSALRLVYGRDDIEAPQYDIQMLAADLMGHPAHEVSAEPERADAAAPARASLVSPFVFWGALGFAVLVLLGLVVRLVSTKN